MTFHRYILCVHYLSRLPQDFHDSKLISRFEKQLRQNSDAVGCSSDKFAAMY